ncbi:MAG TPA: hypothetical protein VHY20_08540 [Pirellulales bacterium]|nr:hypothetical protein [Pirellulales bacterium]
MRRTLAMRIVRTPASGIPASDISGERQARACRYAGATVSAAFHARRPPLPFEKTSNA